MNQKVLFFDIDGTLIIEGTGEIPKSTQKAVKEAREQGHLLFINTGRTRYSLPKEIIEMGFDGYVCGCGTHIFLGNREILKAELEHEFCKEVAETVRSYQVPVFYEASHGIYFDREISGNEVWQVKAEELFQIQGRDVSEILDSEDQTYDKLVVVLQDNEKENRLKAYLSEHFLCIDRTHGLYEIVQKGYSKATGIQFICDYLGKSLEDCYVFGDSENDRSMLEAVPNSIAMGNASEAIKRSCSYVTDSIEQDGIYNALKYLELIK